MTDFRESYREELKQAEVTLGRLTELVLGTETSSASLQERAGLVAKVAWAAREDIPLSDIQSAEQLFLWLVDRTDNDRLVSRVYKFDTRSYQIMIPPYLLEQGRGGRHTAFVLQAIRSLSPAYQVWEF